MLRKFFGYIWGTIVHPRATFDELAQLTSIRPAVMVIILLFKPYGLWGWVRIERV